MEKYIKRDAENLVFSALDAGYIAAILGARQTGKTTLMEKLKEEFIKKGFSEGRIFSFNFDDVILRNNVASDFYFIRNTIEKSLGRDLTTISSPIVLFIDEAQKVPDVFELVKIIHDDFKDRVKIVLSGSASLEIQKRSAESLAGRIQYIYLYPLSITEILKDRFSSSQESLFESLPSGKISYSNLQKQQASIIGGWKRKREFDLILERLLLDGGLPAVWQNPKEKERVFKSLTETYLDKDIRSLKEVGNLEDFSRLLRLFSLEIGGILNVSNLSQASGLAVNTLKKYQSILAASFVLNKLEPLLIKARKGFVKSPKIYFFDIGVANFLAHREEYAHLAAAKVEGQAFENVILKSLESYNKNLLRPFFLSFWRDYQGHEIDLVISKGEEVIPVEITLGEKISSDKKRNFRHFFGSYSQAKFGLIVYNGDLGKIKIAGKQIFLIPWWMWW